MQSKTPLAKTVKTVRKVLLQAVLIIIASFGLFPFIWTTSASFKNLEEFYELRPALLPRNPTIMNYVYVFRGVGQGGQASGAAYMLILYRNSIITTVVSTVATVAISSLAGYAFARLQFRGRDAIFSFFIVLMFLPAGGTLMALYALMRSLKLLDSLLGLILVFTGGGGTALFLMRQIFLNVPQDIEDAARVDGASNRRIAFQIMFPLATSGMVLIAIMSFIGGWGQYLLPATFIRTAENMTLPIGVYRVITVANNLAQVRSLPSPGVEHTVMLLMVVPVLIVFIVMQKWFIRGAVEGLKL
jgi:ABC-type glycerol-3-phosphate transport system permease component